MTLPSTRSSFVRCRSRSTLGGMGTATKRTLAFLLLLSATAAAQEVRSANGKFLARVKPSGDIEVVTRTESTPVTRWTAHSLGLAPADTWLLADDGRALVAVALHAPISRPIVQVVREGKLLASAVAAALGLAPALAPDWLARGWAPLRLRSIEREGREEFALDLLGADALVRRVDLTTGMIRLPQSSARAPDLGALRVETAATVEGTETAFVGEWFAPEALFAGQPLPVHVRGNLPTPTWRFTGFALKTIGDGSSLVLLPRATAPPPGSISIQVLKGFDETASVFGLRPGLYKLGVSGRSASEEQSLRDLRPVRVLPAGILAFLQRTGGMVGSHECVSLFEDGRVELRAGPAGAPGYFLATDDERAVVARSLARLPAAPARGSTGGVDDGYDYELAWISDGHPVRALRDDSNMEPEVRAFVLALDPLLQGSFHPTRFELDPDRSFVEVRTESSGLLSAFGHEHRLMVRALNGWIDANLADLSRSGFILNFEPGSLAVVDDESQKDRPAIEKEMNEHVLETARFPSLGFWSKSVEVKSVQGDITSVELVGDLDLHGQAHPIRVPARIEIRGESLRATGKVRLKLTDFGISPPSAAAGTVKVADEVEISFDVVAVRAGAAPR